MDRLDVTRKATILVVDDTPDNLALMSNLLKGAREEPSGTQGQ